jgi:hypothetical protein
MTVYPQMDPCSVSLPREQLCMSVICHMQLRPENEWGWADALGQSKLRMIFHTHFWPDLSRPCLGKGNMSTDKTCDLYGRCLFAKTTPSWVLGTRPAPNWQTCFPINVNTLDDLYSGKWTACKGIEKGKKTKPRGKIEGIVLVYWALDVRGQATNVVIYLSRRLPGK